MTDDKGKFAHVIRLHNPFQPDHGRDIFEVTAPLTIRQWLDEAGITEFNRPTVCLLNGEALLRKDWPTIVMSEGDIVTFITLPQGGGRGGGGGGKILATVLTIAVMVVAPFVGGVLAGALGVTSAIGTGLITAGVAFAGAALVNMALVNILVPPPLPSTSLQSGFGNTPAPSPTYSLQAQGNQARLSQPIPVIYGRHIIYPDLAATPYATYAHNDQYLYQLHCIGQGEYDLEQIRIEDTPISSFEEITYEIIGPGKQVTLFDVNVVTAPEVAGQELLNSEDGGKWIGPFVVNSPETKARSIGIDVVMAQGIYYAEDDGNLGERSITWTIQAREIDDEGKPLGNWTALGTEAFKAATNTPQRLTYSYSVKPGRYEVQMLRTDTKDKSARAGHELRWAGLKAVLDHKTDFGQVTLLALKMRATDNLSQRSSRLVNCIVTRKLPLWDQDKGWSKTLQPTRSIAWALADIARADYGGKLPDKRIDLLALKALDTVWQARSDFFDAVFDQTVTVWEALSRTARCGRAVSFMQSGIIRFIRDEQRTLPVALFSPRNIVKNSLKIDYLLASDDTADSVTVEYFSSQTWQNDEITVSLSENKPEQPARVRLFGCTDKAQAKREGYYMAAANRYRRRLITFQTELEGLIPTYGDLIAITHDMPSWGQGAEVVAVEENTLTLSEPLTWQKEGDHFISLRKPNGSISGPWRVLPGANANQVVLQDKLDFVPYTGETQERSHVAFGAGKQWSTLARVTSIRPRHTEDSQLIEISAVAENDAVHNADQSGYAIPLRQGFGRT